MDINVTEQANEVRKSFQNYDQEGEVPLKEYGLIISFYASAFAGAYYLSAKKQKVKKRTSAADLALMGVAAYRLSRHITKDKITAVFRAPFTKRGESTGLAEVTDISQGKGMQRAIADLITCPFCLGMWVSTFLSFGLIWAPRFTRFVSSVLVVDSISDVMQIAYGKLKKG